MCRWHTQEVLTAARECCGGQGFLSANRIGEFSYKIFCVSYLLPYFCNYQTGILRSSTDAYVTFEGDNVVLMQQVAASLLKQFNAEFARGPFGPFIGTEWLTKIPCTHSPFMIFIFFPKECLSFWAKK
jgi:acyl-CoA oxidase